MPVTCPSCDHENPDEAVKCESCGEVLPAVSERVTLVIERDNLSIPDKEKEWRTADAGESRTVKAHIERDTRHLVLPPGETVTVGRVDRRSAKKPDLDLTAFDAQSKGVSRLHARLRFSDSMVQVQDLKSTNGTFLNEKQLPPHEWRIVRSGDEVRLGELVLKLYFGEDS